MYLYTGKCESNERWKPKGMWRSDGVVESLKGSSEAACMIGFVRMLLMRPSVVIT